MKSLLSILWRVLAVTVGMLLIMELVSRIIYGGPAAIIATGGIDHLGQKFLFNFLAVITFKTRLIVCGLFL